MQILFQPQDETAENGEGCSVPIPLKREGAKMSREPLNLEEIRRSVNANASALMRYALLLCDELERVTAERDKLREGGASAPQKTKE